MTEAQILHAFQHSPIGETMRAVPWLFAALETAHFIGLSILLGAIFIIDVRLLGRLRMIPFRSVVKLIPFAIFGFGLNVVSGAGFFCSNPMMYWPNPAFKLKMFLVALAGLNAVWFAFAEERRVLRLDDHAATDTQMKVTAGLSLFFWFSVILLGRLLPTFEGSNSFFN